MISPEDGHAVAQAIVRLSRLMIATRSRISTLGEGLDSASVPYLFAIMRGARRISEIADVTVSDVSVVSRQVSALVQRGYVAKQRDPADGRAHTLDITADGYAFIEHLQDLRAQWVARLLADWPHADVENLIRLVDRLSDAVHHELYTAGANNAVDVSRKKETNPHE